MTKTPGIAIIFTVTFNHLNNQQGWKIFVFGSLSCQEYHLIVLKKRIYIV